MNELAIANKNVYMSSKEISKLTSKRHDNILRDIKIMAKGLYDLEIDASDLRNQSNQGVMIIYDERRYIAEVMLDRSHTMTLVTGYDPKLRKAVVDRMHELEEKPADIMAMLRDPKQLCDLLIYHAGRAQELSAKVEEMQPAVDACDRIEKSDGSMCMTDAAKTLQVQPLKFITKLHSMDWIYRRGASAQWIARQEKIKQGLLEHKVTLVTKDDGTEKTISQVRVTPKGLVKLGKLFEPVEA